MNIHARRFEAPVVERAQRLCSVLGAARFAACRLCLTVSDPCQTPGQRGWTYILSVFRRRATIAGQKTLVAIAPASTAHPIGFGVRYPASRQQQCLAGSHAQAHESNSGEACVASCPYKPTAATWKRQLRTKMVKAAASATKCAPMPPR
jgi:hypothetical protein